MTYPNPRGRGVPRQEQPSWDQLFSPDDFALLATSQVGARMPSPKPNRSPLIVIAVALVVVVVTALTVWLVQPRSESRTATETSPTATVSTSAAAPTTTDRAKTSAEQQRRLIGLLPRGYPPSACTPTTVPAGMVARVKCGRNADVGGPASATYSLASNADALTDAFDALVRSSTVVDCPGRIQSPVHCPTGRVERVRGVVSVSMDPMPVR